MKAEYSKQSARILACLRAASSPVPMPELQSAASGRQGGYVASFSKRISELRSQGFEVVKVVDEWIDGQRRTAYQLFETQNDERRE